MEEKNIVLVILQNLILVADLQQVSSELGEADLVINNPFVVQNSQTITLEPWLSDVTKNKSFKIHSDKVITLTDPSPSILEKYIKLTE